MNENNLREMTLATWATSVWERELRGVPLQSHEAALAYCMRQHKEWLHLWNQLGASSANNAKTVNTLVHIYNDAAVKLQLDRNDPPEIQSLYQSMRAHGVMDMDALHVIAFALQEQTWNTKETGGTFDMGTYIERVQTAVHTYLEHRQLTRVGG